MASDWWYKYRLHWDTAWHFCLNSRAQHVVILLKSKIYLTTSINSLHYNNHVEATSLYNSREAERSHESQRIWEVVQGDSGEVWYRTDTSWQHHEEKGRDLKYRKQQMNHICSMLRTSTSTGPEIMKGITILNAIVWAANWQNLANLISGHLFVYIKNLELANTRS